jgi:uncharacterized protein (TIGR00369 family)
MSAYDMTPKKPDRDVPAPAGWRVMTVFDPFEAHLGPYFDRAVAGAREFAILLDDRHTNAQGVAHGGTLLTFADSCFGYAIWDATDNGNCVTVSQQSNFLAAASSGDLVTCRPEITRKTREILFIRGDFHVGDKVIFTATAIWKLFPKS